MSHRVSRRKVKVSVPMHTAARAIYAMTNRESTEPFRSIAGAVELAQWHIRAWLKNQSL
jgi:hypothetical protein